MQDLINQLNAIIWSPALIGLCLAAGLFFSIKTRFIQVRYLPEMIRLLGSNKSNSAGISSLQALTMSLAGRVGTGNIAGVAAAIGFGGPGAIFWMWVIAFLGAATAFVESTFGQIYKEELGGQFRGGPAFYIEKALGWKRFAQVFAVVTVVSAGFLMPGVQSNSIANAVTQALNDSSLVSSNGFEMSGLITGVIVAVILMAIIFGGIKRIAKFTEIVVPAMAVLYVVIAAIIIGMHVDILPAIFGQIFSDAFSPMAGVGAAIGWGVKRGVYSNEAGQGTGPHAAAAANVDHPAQQGMVQALSVYIDTLCICTATALMILIAGTYNVHAPEAGFLVQNLAADISASSPAFTQLAIEHHFPGFGSLFVAVALSGFAFTTIVAYYYIAETNLSFLMRNVNIPFLPTVLKLAIVAATFYGCIRTADLAWGLGDLGVGLMAWLNLIAIFCIFYRTRPALKALDDYSRQQDAGVEKFTFSPEALDIKNAHYWVKRNQEEKPK